GARVARVLHDANIDTVVWWLPCLPEASAYYLCARGTLFRRIRIEIKDPALDTVANEADHYSQAEAPRPLTGPDNERTQQQFGIRISLSGFGYLVRPFCDRSGGIRPLSHHLLLRRRRGSPAVDVHVALRRDLVVERTRADAACRGFHDAPSVPHSSVRVDPTVHFTNEAGDWLCATRQKHIGWFKVCLLEGTRLELRTVCHRTLRSGDRLAYGAGGRPASGARARARPLAVATLHSYDG